MKLFLVSNLATDNFSCDYYDSFVICCNNINEAWQAHPTGNHVDELAFDDWPTNTKYVNVKYLGEADQDLPAGIVCFSFNAG